MRALEAEGGQIETEDRLIDTVDDFTVVGKQVSGVGDSEASILPSKSGSSTFHPLRIARKSGKDKHDSYFKYVRVAFKQP